MLSNKTLIIIFSMATVIAAFLTTLTENIIAPGHFFLSVFAGLGVTIMVFSLHLTVTTVFSKEDQRDDSHE